MKVLSLYQPWASALFTPLKPDETRGYEIPAWLTGQVMAIHAARKDCAELREFWDDIAETSDLGAFKAIGIARYEDLPRGAIIGTLTFIACHRTATIGPERTMAEREWGCYSHGRFAWERSGAVLFPRPIPYAGKPWIFDWTPGSPACPKPQVLLPL